VSRVALQPATRALTAAQEPLVFNGEGPATYTLDLAGGVYVVGVTAAYDPSTDSGDTGECSFYGHIDGVQNPVHVELSDARPVVGMVDYFYNPVEDFAAGQ
jgi:hypothetical protein